MGTFSLAGDEITSFRTTAKEKQQLKQELFRDGISKKDWLQSKIARDKAQQEVALDNSESFVTIPCFEYVELLSHSEDHHSYIFDRIRKHKFHTDKMDWWYFDVLLEDVISFCKMNNFLYSRFNLDDYEVLHIEHCVGLEFSSFVSGLISHMIDIDVRYTKISEKYDATSLTLKIKRNNVDKWEEFPRT